MGIFDLLNQSEQELLRDCELETKRGSGPGGTKADTTESAVRITHQPTGITVSCAQSRSQSDNRRIALRKLKEQYALRKRHRLQLDGVTIPGKLKQYFDNGLRVKRGNPHYPFVVKLVLDVFYSADGRLSETGDLLGISTNELTRFFKDHPEVLGVANQIREDNDHHPIK